MQGQLRLTGGRKLVSPKGSLTRPTSARVREAVMNILAPQLPGCRWLDLCSGSGVMGCEALQRGARSIVAIERDSRSAKLCERNLLDTKQGCNSEAAVKVLREDVLSWLKRGCNSSGFDVVYLDPPYQSGLYQPVLSLLSDQQWLTSESTVVCEHASAEGLDPSGDWITLSRRHYGTTSLLFLNRPERFPHDGTDSKPPQTTP